MKRLILFLIIAIVFTTSCENNDYSIEYIDDEVKQDFSISSLVIDRNRVAATSHVSFTVSIETALSVDATVTVASRNMCGSPISHLAETSTGTALIKAGDTTGTGSIFFADVNKEYYPIPYDGFTDCASFDVTGIALSEGDDPYVAAPLSVSTTLTAPNPDYMGDADDDAVMISMDWKNPASNDFDMYVTDSVLYLFYEKAESGSRFEGDTFDNDNDSYYPAADGVYIVWYAPYTQEAADVPAEIYFTHPVTGVVDVVSFVSANGTADWPPTPVATITKTTDADGKMSYEIAAF